MAYLVVEFTNTQTVAVVPSCWIIKSNNKYFSRWPDHLKKKPNQLRLAAKTSQSATEEFKKYEVKILKKFVKYDDAERYTKKLENESFSHSSAERSLGRGKRKIRKRQLYSSSSEEEDIISDSNTESDLDLMSHRKSSTPKSASSESHTNAPRLPELPLEIPETVTEYDLRTPTVLEVSNRRTVENWTLEDVVKNQIQILARIDILQKSVTELLAAKNISEGVPENLPISFPIKNLNEFEEFENYLFTKNNAQSMFGYLKPFATMQIMQSVNNILKEVLSSEVAALFNYNGRIPKRKFADTNLNKLLFYTTRSVAGCNKIEYKNAVMKWLKYAPQRLKNARSKNIENDAMIDQDLFN